MDFIGREAQANEAKKAVIKMMDFITKTEGYDSADVGMLVTSMGSGMTSVTRRAANFKYIGIGVENSKNPGKELEYEHMIPQVEMSLKVLKSYIVFGRVIMLLLYLKQWIKFLWKMGLEVKARSLEIDITICLILVTKD